MTQGLRSKNEQHALYLQGREPLDVVNELRSAVGWAAIDSAANHEVVTHADYFDSMHCYGLAVDADPSAGTLMQPFKPDWETQDENWEKVLSIAAKYQLAEGALWTAVKRDYPHLYPVELEANPTDEMKQTFKDTGLQQVWAALNLA